MSYFLEDTFSASSSNVIIDYTGINESMFNAELAWSNIMENAMKNEYQAIKNEDSSMLQEGISDFFEAIKDWFKKMIASITRVLENIKNKILVKTNYYGRWALNMAKKLPKVQKRIDKVKKQETRKIYSYDYNLTVKLLKHSDVFKDLGEELKKVNSSLKIEDKSDYNDEIEKLNKSYKESKETIERCKASKHLEPASKFYSIFSPNLVKDMLDEIKNANDDVKKTMNGFNSAIKVCKIGIKYADKENKDEATSQKFKAQYINQVSSRYLNIEMARISLLKTEATWALKPLISVTNDKDDFDTKYSKASERITKQDSYNGF